MQCIEHIRLKDGLVTEIVVGHVPIMFGDDDGEDTFVIPGPTGIQGLQGNVGATVFLEPDQPDEVIQIPGQPGPQGNPGIGIQGVPGVAVFLDLNDPEDAFVGNPNGQTVLVATVPQGGTGVSVTIANSVLCGGTSTTSAIQGVAIGTPGRMLLDQGAGALSAFQAMAGDATLAGTGTLTLANTTVSAGTYGSSAQVPQIVFDAKGRAIGASNTAISPIPAVSTYTPLANGTAAIGSATTMFATGNHVHPSAGVAMGTFTKNTADASGTTTTVSGLAFAPRTVMFYAIGGSGSESSNGTSTATGHYSVANQNAVSAGTWGVSQYVSIYLWQSATISYYGAITSLNSDGFVVTWTKTGAKTGTATVCWIAFG